MKALYTAVAAAHGGREGHVKPIRDAPCTGRVTRSVPDAKYLLSVELEAHVDGLSAEETLVLMHAVHEVCPSSSAIRGNLDVRVSAR